MKISASIYSSKDGSIKDVAKNIEKYDIDCLHIDCNDNFSVFTDIEEIKNHTNLSIDLHLITSEPEKYYDKIKQLSISQVTFQYENLTDNFIFPADIAPKVGIAIMNDTPIDVFKQFSENATHILFMTTTPGVSGGAFNKHTFSKIRQFRTRFPEKEIHVDGGVNDKVSFILRNMGVHCAVIGSFLFKDHVGYSFLKLQSNEISSTYTAEDFMLEHEEIPILQENNFTFLELLQKIDDYGMGLAIISDDNKKLSGLITNADIRKALIKNFENIGHINPNDIINHNPVVVQDINTVQEIIKFVKKQSFPIQFLPVVDKDRKIKGLLRFNNLIKGEL
ncbi:MAG: hypothetical protein JXL97_20415 [Bacteroidales bacterium]|nr:hypothetical protein [Bacteroidales bacterium]